MPAGNTQRPYRYSTRQRCRQIATVPINLGNQTSIELPRVGMLSYIMLVVNATLTLSAAGAWKGGAMGPYPLFRRIRVNLNSGTSIYDCSGWGTANVGERFIRSGGLLSSGDVFQSPSASGANQLNFALVVPIAVNDQEQFAIGQINLQAPEVRCTLDLTFEDGNNLITNFSSLTGSVTASYVYYDVPDPRTTLVPPFMVHRILEERQNIVADGDQVYTVPRGGQLMTLMHLTTLNGTPATLTVDPSSAHPGALQNFRFVINKADEIYNYPAGILNFKQVLDHGLYTGFGAEYNFFDGGPTRMGEGDSRDWIDTEAVSTIESFVTLAPGAVSGSANFLDTIRRILQPLAA